MRIAFDAPLVKALFGLERQRGKKIVIIERSHASRKACNNLILFLEPGEEPGALAENCRHKSSPKAVVFRHNISKLILWICCAECLLPSSDGNKPRLFLFGLLDLAQRKQPFFNEPFSKSRQGENMEKGFTLIELLVVVLIIGILAAVALPQYEKAVEKSRAAEALALVKTIGQANQVYFMSNGNYTTDLRDLDIDIPGTDAVHSVPRRVSKYFSYRASLNTASNDIEGIALANRLPINTRYAIGYMPDNTLKCFYKEDKDKTFCESLNLPTDKVWQ